MKTTGGVICGATRNPCCGCSRGELARNKFNIARRVRIRRFFEEPAPQTSCGASPPAEAVLRLGLRPTGGDPFGAVATLASRTRGDGTSFNAPKRKPRMRTLSHNPLLFLAGHRPGASGSGLASNESLTGRRVPAAVVIASLCAALASAGAGGEMAPARSDDPACAPRAGFAAPLGDALDPSESARIEDGNVSFNFQDIEVRARYS